MPILYPKPILNLRNEVVFMTADLKPYTPQDAQSVYTRGEKFKQDPTWNHPRYDWTIQNTQQLQQFSLVDMTQHLKTLLAAQAALNNLKQTYHQKTLNFTTHYNKLKDQINSGYQNYVWQNQHPHLNDYYTSHHTHQLPTEKPINNADTRFAKRGMLMMVLIFFFMNTRLFDYLMGPIWIGLPLISLIFIGFFGFPLLYIAAKLHLPFSQPIPLYRNLRIRALKRSIARADKRYCKSHDRYNQDLLKSEFKYDDSVTANCSTYVNQMQATQTKTAAARQRYVQIIQQEIIFFPPADTADMRHLFRIYAAFLDGRATNWQEASVYVDQHDQIEKLQNSLIDELQSAKRSITNSINQTRQELTKEIRQTTRKIQDLDQSVNEQTRDIDQWNTVQTEIMDYQTHLMEKADRRASA